MPTCFICKDFFPDYKKLALHIQTTKGHGKSKLFAAKVLCDIKVHDKPHRVQDLEDKSTPYGDEQRANMKIQLTGETQYANCICPNRKCRQEHRPLLPVEFLGLEHLWKINGKIAVLCDSCRH